MKKIRKSLSILLAVAMLTALLALPTGVYAATGMAGGTFVKYPLTTSASVNETFDAVTDYMNGSAKIEDGVLKFYKGAQDATWGTESRLPNGMTELAMDVKAQAENYLIWEVNDYAWWNNKTEVMHMQNGKFHIGSSNADFVDNTVYHIVMELEPGNGDMTVKILNPDGSVLVQNVINKKYENSLQTFIIRGGWDSDTEVIEIDNMTMAIKTTTCGMNGGKFDESTLPFVEDFSVKVDTFNGSAVIADGVLKVGPGSQSATWKLNEDVTDGKLEMTMKITPDMNRMQICASPSGWWSDSQEILLFEKDGNVSVNSSNKKAFTPGTTYDLKVVFDIAGKKAEVKLSNPDGSVFLEDTKTYTMDKLRTFYVNGGWDSSTVGITIDDLAMGMEGTTLTPTPTPDPTPTPAPTPTPEPSETLFFEDFTNMSTVSDIKSKMVIDNTESAVSIVDLGGERGKVVALTGNAAAGVNAKLAAKLTSGKVTMSVKFYPNSNYYTFRASAENSFSDNEITSLMKDNTLSAVQLIPTNWYTLTAMVDLDAKTISSVVSDADDIIVWSSKGVAYKPTSFGNFGFRGGWDSTNTTYFDDITIKQGDFLPTAPESSVIWEENFDEITQANANALTPNAANTTVSLETVSDEYGKTLGITKSNTNQAELTKTFASKVTSDSVRLTYDVYVNGSNQPIYVKGDGKDFLIAHVTWDKKVCHTNTNGAAEYMVASGLEGWITIENLVNLETKSNTITVYDADGKILGTDIDTELTTDAGVAITEITGFNMRQWDGSDPPKTAYIDNVLIEKVILKPTLADSNVTMLDYTGNAVASITAPSPAVTDIVLDFATKLKEETLNGAVTLKKGTQSVPFTGSVSGTKYTMTVNGLEPKTEYKLTVDNTVENHQSEAMSLAYELTFTTGDGGTGATLVSLTENGESAALKDIATGDTLILTAGFNNTLSLSGMKITYVIAYYVDGVLDDIEMIDETVNLSSGAATMSHSFTAKDMTAVDGIKVFMWTDAYEAIPHCAPIVLQ